jgi:hypothetical protein
LIFCSLTRVKSSAIVLLSSIAFNSSSLFICFAKAYTPYYKDKLYYTSNFKFIQPYKRILFTY